MADHCRKQIRDAVAAYAAANLTTVAAVHVGRVHPLDVLPALLVFTNEETAEDITKNGTLSRVLTLEAEGHAQADNAVDILDAIAAEVEPAVLAALPTWVKECELASTAVELSGAAETPAGLIRLEFSVTYHAKPTAPDTPL
jgi:hypothetical protein